MERIDPSRFLGRWEVRRRVVDHRTGTVHRFGGTAEVTPTGFHEIGRLLGARQDFEARRSYGLAFRDGGVAVTRPDGSFFVRIGADPLLHHLCGDDTYRGRFALRSVDAFVECWDVSGPRKRYTSLTRYRRMQSPRT